MLSPDSPNTVLIACAALGKEVREIAQRHGWEVDVKVINARLHLDPQLIGPAVEEQLEETKDHYRRQVVVYGQCGAIDLDEVLQDHGAVRPLGPHCFEMLGAEDFAQAMREEPGTLILTDFLVRAWEALVVRGLRMDEYPELKDVLFVNYKRVMYFSQVEAPELMMKARDIADWLGLPLEHRHTGYGDLERRLVAIMNGDDQPTSSMTHDGYSPYQAAG